MATTAEMNRTLLTFNIIPRLPEKLVGLRDLALNLHWCWNHDTIDLFRRLDRNLWDEVGRNPIRMLGEISQKKLNEAAVDEGYLLLYERTRNALRSYLTEAKWYEKKFGVTEGPQFAYFSAEFGLTESLPIYSGGLGILAGDHLKSASDMGIPLVGVGLLYQQGYFHQYLNPDGWQQESYPNNDFYQLPLEPPHGPDGRWIKIEVEYPGRTVTARVVVANVGRVTLLLLDTNIPENSPEDRDITDQLYGGDKEMRIKQEILLGMGGVRALHAMGFHPTIYHMNEGHSGFLALERILTMRRQGVTFADAAEAVRHSTIFTTHTPVAAGIDQFPESLVEKYFSYLYGPLGITKQEFLSLGRWQGQFDGEFNMALLCLRMSTRANGVSELHGQVSRKLFHNIWSELPVDEVPIGHITNGVHAPSWISRDMHELLGRYLGLDWQNKQTEEDTWHAVHEIPDEELWRTHERRRERLVAYARRRLRTQLDRRGAPKSEIEAAREVLDGSILTIGFARRFATYKRGDLLLHDPDRLKRILTNRDRPVQFIFAGKAHPADVEGKELIKRIVHFTRDLDIRRRFVFLEDYDMGVARYMVQGVDVWLNNPRRPYEASGTSGMKVVFNGGINLSILDGWWVEGYQPDTGWAIGAGEDYDDSAYQDYVESRALYDLLEKDVIPLFYHRTNDGLPRDWVNKMKHSMQTLGRMFNTNRMVRDYTEKYYQPAWEHMAKLSANGMAELRSLSQWKQRVRRQWDGVSILKISADPTIELIVDDPISISARVNLNGLTPEDVAIEVFFGAVNTDGKLHQGEAMSMGLESKLPDNTYLYRSVLTCTQSGRHGFSVRVVPSHPELAHRHDCNLVRWAKAMG
ncbi:MAG: alpha-glucan family phosphorylase [bacterium]|nr:alpha-glucan family phosphorylase [bacterium]